MLDGSNLDSIKIAVIPANVIDIIWNQVEPMVERVVEKAPDDIIASIVKEDLQAGNKVLVTISKGARIIAINVLDVRILDSGIKVLYIPIVAGDDMEEWMDEFLDLMKQMGKDYGCTELRGLAVRKGWLKKLKPYGWEEVFTTVRCKIGE